MFRTIKGKMIGIFGISLFFTCVVTVFYWANVHSITYKIDLIESFGDLFNDVLEIRRFEKNFFLYRNPKSLDENLHYLEKVEHFALDNSKDIERIAGKDAHTRFIHTLKKYREFILSYKQGKDSSSALPDDVRNQGKELVDFANNLLNIKRRNIHSAFRRTAAVPFIFFGIVFIFQIIVLRILSRLLKPLVLIKHTTEQVATGDFSPISYGAHSRDEISDLIHAFNEMARELETNQEALVQSRKIAAIGTFSAGIAHELNNPLNNISLTAETLLEDASENLSPVAKELILDILNQADRAGEIVKNLLDFSRKDRPLFSELTIDEVITKTLKLLKNQIMLMGIEQQIILPKDLPPIRGHLRNLQQIFMNLLINSIQAMPDGGRITIEARDHSDQFVRIDVSDTGHGIKSEDLERIFDPFFTTKGVGSGTGLGLAVTYGMVKKHGGYIEVQSKVDAGTTFSVYIPKSSAKEALKPL